MPARSNDQERTAGIYALTDAWSKRWHGELLDCVMRCVVQFGGTSLLRSDDPQSTEDQHVKAVKQRSDTP